MVDKSRKVLYKYSPFMTDCVSGHDPTEGTKSRTNRQTKNWTMTRQSIQGARCRRGEQREGIGGE